MIRDFLYTELFEYNDLKFKLLNLILFSCVVCVWFLLRLWINKKFTLFLNKKNWLMPEKEKKLKKLLKQIVFIVFLLLGIKALTYGSHLFSFSNFLDIEIFGFQTGENNDGTISRFRLTIGKLIFFFIILFISKVIISAFRLTIHKTTISKDWIDAYPEAEFSVLDGEGFLDFTT